jgi:hypothetical protein
LTGSLVFSDKLAVSGRKLAVRQTGGQCGILSRLLSRRSSKKKARDLTTEQRLFCVKCHEYSVKNSLESPGEKNCCDNLPQAIKRKCGYGYY